MTNLVKYYSQRSSTAALSIDKGKNFLSIKPDLSHSQENFSLDKMIYGALGFYLLLSFLQKRKESFVAAKNIIFNVMLGVVAHIL